MNKEFYALQASTDKKINELQISNTDALKKLSIYEKLEQELDDVILQAAQCEFLYVTVFWKCFEKNNLFKILARKKTYSRLACVNNLQ